MESLLTRLMSWLGGGPSIIEEMPNAIGAASLDELFEKQIAMSEQMGVQDGKPVFSPWSTARAINDGMKSSTWVYACADLISKAVGSQPMVVKDANGDVLEDNPLSLLLAMPNSFWTSQITLVRMMLHLMLGGNALFHKTRGTIGSAKGAVLELWLIHPDQIKPVPHKTKIVSHYIFTDGKGKKKDIPVEDIIHLQYVDPGNMYWGLSVIQASAKIIDTEIEAVTWNKVAMQNRAVADGMFSFDRNLSHEQWKMARYRIREQHMGSKNARVPWVMDNGTKFTSMQMTPVEMDFIESRKMNRIDICTTFGVPSVLVGDMQAATYDNYRTARLVLWEDRIVPIMVMVEQALTLGLMDDFAAMLPPDSTIEFDLSKNKILNQLTPEKIAVAEGLQGMGWPASDINDRLSMGMKEFPGWDISYLRTAIVPASSHALDPFALLDEGELKQMARVLDGRRQDQLLLEA